MSQLIGEIVIALIFAGGVYFVFSRLTFKSKSKKDDTNE